jgi:thioredoxin-like negative regulator of GroEL
MKGKMTDSEKLRAEHEREKETVKLTLIKLGADWCGPCQSMKKQKTLEKFIDAHDDVKLRVIDIDDPAGEKLADEYEVRAVPSIIFEYDGEELCRDEGAMSLKMLEKLYEKALRKMPEEDETDEESDEDGEDDDGEEDDDSDE